MNGLRARILVVFTLAVPLACVSDDTPDEAGEGLTTTTTAAGDSTTSDDEDSGGDEDSGEGEDSGDGEPEPEPIPPGPCIAIDSAPEMTCDEACAPNACGGGCWGVGQIGATTAYYSSQADCEAEVPLILQVTACSDPFADVQSFFPATHVRCCCDA